MTFKDAATILGTGTLSGGVATLTVPSTSPVIAALAVGTHSITASYGGDTNDLTSTSSALTETVNQNQTTTSVSVSTEYLTDNQAVPLGQEVTLAATVTANESTVAPTGLVDFFDGPTKLDTVTLSHGTATLSTTMLVVGDHTIRADYHGDGANFAGSTSNRVISISTINKVAGGGTNDADGVPATSARLNAPTGVAVDASGNLFIADTSNNRVRMVSPAGIIYTIAGGGTADFGVNGVPATSARLNAPTGVVVDASGNLFIADTGDNRICKISPAGSNGYLSGIITLYAGGGTEDFGGGVPATSARLNAPTGVAVDASGNLFIADTGSNRICEVSRDGSMINTFAGGGETMDFGGGVLATSAQFNAPTGVAVDAFGNLFIADTGNNRICKVDGDPMIITVAGGLDAPTGVAADRSGNVVFVDSREIGQLIPKGNPSDPRTIYQIITVAPRQTFNFATGGTASTLAGIAVDPFGKIFVADPGSNQIFQITNAVLPAGVVPVEGGVLSLPPPNNTQPAIQLVPAQSSSLALIATLVVTSLNGGESQIMSVGSGTASVLPTQATAPSGTGGEGAHADDESANPLGGLSILIPTALRPWVLVLLGTNEALARIRGTTPDLFTSGDGQQGPVGLLSRAYQAVLRSIDEAIPGMVLEGLTPSLRARTKGRDIDELAGYLAQEGPAQPERARAAVPVAAGPATEPAEVLPDTSKSTRFRLVNLLAVSVASIGALTFTRVFLRYRQRHLRLGVRIIPAPKPA